MKRGPIVIVIMLVLAVTAALLAVWFHYHNQRRAQQFWGTTTAVLIDKAPQVELLALGEANRDIALEDDALDAPAPEESDPDAEPAARAVVFNEIPWMVVQTKDAAAARGLANLRRALVLDNTFDWTAPPVPDEPHWQFGLAMNDGRNWATVLFDFDTRQVGLTGGRKTARLDPEANKDFHEFFAEQFPESAKQQTDSAEPTREQDEGDKTGSGQDEQE